MSTIEKDLTEIRQLLTEAYKHYFKHSDGHCKSSEGAIALHYPPFFWELDNQNPEPSIEIYSYVLGPHRSHYFENSAEALKEVKRWHQRAMASTYNAWGGLD